jgi:hypothetical protein
MDPEPGFATCHCHHCGGGIEFPTSGADTWIVCPHCGKETVLVVALPPAPASELGPDTPLFNESGILITKTRLVFPGRTFAMANVSSVRGIIIPAKRGFPIFLALLGLFLSFANIYVGGVVIVLGLGWMTGLKDWYGIGITAAGGDVTGFETPDKNLADRILVAIERAIIARG